MVDWLREAADWLGKAIPNEVGKLNSVTKYIPYIGQVSQILSSADAASTAYGDTGDVSLGFQAGYSGFSGSIDPGMYGSSGDANRDIWNYIGQAGNAFSNPMSIMGNPYFGTEDYRQDNLFGLIGKQQQVPQPVSRYQNLEVPPSLRQGYAPRTNFGGYNNPVFTQSLPLSGGF